MAERKIGIPMTIKKFLSNSVLICCRKLHGMEHWKWQENYNWPKISEGGQLNSLL